MKTPTPVTAYIPVFNENADIVGSEKVTVLNYDNDKYCQIVYGNGNNETIKRGYIYRNADLTKYFSGCDWWVLGGHTRRSYKPRKTYTEWNVYSDDIITKSGGWNYRIFRSKKEAVKFATNKSKELKTNVTISSYFSQKGNHYSYSQNGQELICYPDGYVVQFGFKCITTMSKRVRGEIVKYRNGYGKKSRFSRKLRNYISNTNGK